MNWNRIESARLILRRWNDDDLAPYAALNADPRVMEFFPSLLTGIETQALVGRYESGFGRNGFGTWAVELKETGECIGSLGLAVPTFDAPFMPCVEISWRLAFAHWGKGYATEGAAAVLDFAFTMGLPEIVAFTAMVNLPSRRVMEKLGMEQELFFAHPRVAEDSPLREHVLYRTRSPFKAPER